MPSATEVRGSFSLTHMLALPDAWRTVSVRVSRTRWIEWREVLVNGQWGPAGFWDAISSNLDAIPSNVERTRKGITAWLEKEYGVAERG